MISHPSLTLTLLFSIVLGFGLFAAVWVGRGRR